MKVTLRVSCEPHHYEDVMEKVMGEANKQLLAHRESEVGTLVVAGERPKDGITKVFGYIKFVTYKYF